ncbi:MAG TPA: NnrS family protein, partial [Campylobacterales bacterium]|nr:NnrS family protein [Campylobacterales bacterium]
LTSIISIFSDINFMFLDIHILVLGFVFTVLIGFGTRVTLGHSGNKLEADRLTTILFYWTQVVVISRMVTSLIFSFGWNFLFWFDITVTAWLVLFGVWAYRFFGVLIFGRKLES